MVFSEEFNLKIFDIYLKAVLTLYRIWTKKKNINIFVNSRTKFIGFTKKKKEIFI